MLKDGKLIASPNAQSSGGGTHNLLSHIKSDSGNSHATTAKTKEVDLTSHIG